MQLSTGWVTHVGLTSESFPCLRNHPIIQRLLSEHEHRKKGGHTKWMICVLVASGWLPTEDAGIHLPSGCRIHRVSGQIDGHVLMKLPLLIHQLSLPNWQVMKLIRSSSCPQSSQPCLEVILSLWWCLCTSSPQPIRLWVSKSILKKWGTRVSYTYIVSTGQGFN